MRLLHTFRFGDWWVFRELEKNFSRFVFLFGRFPSDPQFEKLTFSFLLKTLYISIGYLFSKLRLLHKSTLAML